MEPQLISNAIIRLVTSHTHIYMCVLLNAAVVAHKFTEVKFYVLAPTAVGITRI